MATFIRRNLYIIALLQIILEKLACLLANRELILAYPAPLLEDQQLIRKFAGLLVHFTFLLEMTADHCKLHKKTCSKAATLFEQVNLTFHNYFRWSLMRAFISLAIVSYGTPSSPVP